MNFSIKVLTQPDGGEGQPKPWTSECLGFTFTNSVEQPLIRLHWKTVKRMKERVRELTGRSSGRSVKRVVGELTLFLRGWWNYFGVIQSRNRLARLGKGKGVKSFVVTKGSNLLL